MPCWAFERSARQTRGMFCLWHWRFLSSIRICMIVGKGSTWEKLDNQDSVGHDRPAGNEGPARFGPAVRGLAEAREDQGGCCQLLHAGPSAHAVRIDIFSEFRRGGETRVSALFGLDVHAVAGSRRGMIEGP